MTLPFNYLKVSTLVLSMDAERGNHQMKVMKHGLTN